MSASNNDATAAGDGERGWVPLQVRRDRQAFERWWADDADTEAIAELIANLADPFDYRTHLACAGQPGLPHRPDSGAVARGCRFAARCGCRLDQSRYRTGPRRRRGRRRRRSRAVATAGRLQPGGVTAGVDICVQTAPGVRSRTGHQRAGDAGVGYRHRHGSGQHRARRPRPVQRSSPRTRRVLTVGAAPPGGAAPRTPAPFSLSTWSCGVRSDGSAPSAGSIPRQPAYG